MLEPWGVFPSRNETCFPSDDSIIDRENNCEREGAFYPITSGALSNHAQHTRTDQCRAARRFPNCLGIAERPTVQSVFSRQRIGQATPSASGACRYRLAEGVVTINGEETIRNRQAIMSPVSACQCIPDKKEEGRQSLIRLSRFLPNYAVYQHPFREPGRRDRRVIEPGSYGQWLTIGHNGAACE